MPLRCAGGIYSVQGMSRRSSLSTVGSAIQDIEESAQNAYWYREIYSPVKNTPEVLQAHRSFLLYRDAASGLFIFLIGLLVWPVIAVLVSLPSPGVWSLLLLVGVILLLGQAGRQSGERMVTNAAAVGLEVNRQ